MYRFLRIVEIMWLAIAAVSLVEVYFNFTRGDQSKAWIFVGFFAVAMGMFFFRRWNRKRMLAKKKDSMKQL
jgi:hypothetical protein